jgi:hypothetical protein
LFFGEEIVFASGKRPVGERLLMSTGCSYHVITYKIEKPAYLETGRAETVGKRDRERAIRSFAIQCRFSVLGGKYDEGSWFRFNGGQPSS